MLKEAEVEEEKEETKVTIKNTNKQKHLLSVHAVITKQIQKTLDRLSML